MLDSRCRVESGYRAKVATRAVKSSDPVDTLVRWSDDGEPGEEGDPVDTMKHIYIYIWIYLDHPMDHSMDRQLFMKV